MKNPYNIKKIIIELLKDGSYNLAFRMDKADCSKAEQDLKSYVFHGVKTVEVLGEFFLRVSSNLYPTAIITFMSGELLPVDVSRVDEKNLGQLVAQVNEHIIISMYVYNNPNEMLPTDFTNSFYSEFEQLLQQSMFKSENYFLYDRFPLEFKVEILSRAVEFLRKGVGNSSADVQQSVITNSSIPIQKLHIVLVHDEYYSLSFQFNSKAGFHKALKNANEIYRLVPGVPRIEKQLLWGSFF